MARNGIVIRDATPRDIPVMEALTRASLERDLRLHSGLKSYLGSGHGSAVDEIDFGAAVSDPELRVIVAVDRDDDVCGLAVLSEDQVSALIKTPAVSVSYLIVPPDRRNRGIGKLLLTEVAQFAEQIEAESVIVGVSSDSREINRYFARFGFAPLVVRRIATIPTLRRTLGMAEPVVSRTEARRRAVLARLAPGRTRRNALTDTSAG